jgi:hypothetical protein
MLQSRAAEKRDQAIADARREYRHDIEAVEALERRLPPILPPINTAPLGKVPSIVDLIRALVPNDKPFTVTDMMHLLHDAHHGQKFHQPTVRTHTSRLCSQGHLRRLYKTGQMETLYVLAESAVTEGPVETKTLAEVTAEILAESSRPLKVTEIVVMMRARGYRADNVPGTLARAVRDMFKRYRGRFARGKDGRWAVYATIRPVGIRKEVTTVNTVNALRNLSK